ncbi:hypothetical protein PQJ75_13525 [Rhodoplanes sp. TEM]|uniref:Uncharacterized protein n=1 Tax=Rhodoplanes tepidamans TaxID=200616 RepID=A0ABT5JD36_RHOTP|nr:MULTISPECIES: hypothetical protein [Rhodoplanes]MDC7787368.1 hypothetical protein [Rhodoplanes tepidamans]MDC7984750.1 hypothetical protein [Rhodoplanes sp. TEM]MDQ0358279.1 hypothetical protein [Rhodoplanes tepidamans]
MAKKASTTAETAAVAPAGPAGIVTVEPAAYYRVEALTRFRFAGAGFGPLSRTEVTGELLTRLLASEHAGKVVRWGAVADQPTG